jgi:hypothetical protein
MKLLLSIQQRYILELLQKAGSLRRRQLLILTRERFRPQGIEITDAKMETMLRQLKTGADIRLNDDVVQLPLTEPDLRRLEAIDIMLELSGGHQQDFKVHLPAPAVLRFVYGEDQLRVMTVALLSEGGDAALDTMERRRAERIVWFAEDGKLPEELLLPAKHFFAARQEDGTHRFYGG